MKNPTVFFLLFLCVTVLTVFSCSKDKEMEIADNAKVVSDEGYNLLSPEDQEKYDLYKDEINSVTVLPLKSPITYLGDACGSTGENSTYGPFSPCTWDYYSFTANAGDPIDIYVNRTSPGLDPIAFLYSGTATDCSLVNWNGGGGLTFLTSSDDAQCCLNSCSCFSDPHIVATAPVTGTYTLTVGHYASCGGPYTYIIDCAGGNCPPPVTDSDNDGVPDDSDNCPNTPNPDQADADSDGSGDVCDVCPFDPNNDADGDGLCGDVDNCPDTANPDQADYDSDGSGDACDNDDDGDGCDDANDAHPYSNQSANVVIDGCDSGVANALDTSTCGSNFMDLIMDCAANANNHGQFVSCVAQLTNDWKKDGLITGAQKGAIQSCAAQANIP